MIKTLKRVILLAILIGLVQAAFWPWEGKEEKDDNAAQKKSKRSKRSRSKKEEVEPSYDVSQNDENMSASMSEAEVPESRPEKRESRSSKKEASATKNADKIKQRRRFQQTAPDLLKTSEVKAAFENEIFDETIGAEDADGVSDKEITKLWQEHMHDFVPEDMVNFIIPDKQHLVLFETIGHMVPTKIKGAYYVKGGSSSKYVSVMVLDPTRKVVYMKKQAPQHIILFDSSVPGEYSFIFGNFNSGQDVTVTMALHTYELRKEEPIEYDLDDAGNRIIRGQPKTPSGESEQSAYSNEMPDAIDLEFQTENGVDKAATGEDISVLRSLMRQAQTSIKQVQTEAKMSLLRQSSHNEDLMENTNWSVFSILIEASVFVGILAF